MIKITS